MKFNVRSSILTLFTCAVVAMPAAAKELHSGGPEPITKKELMAAQEGWISGLLAISEAHRNGEDYAALAGDIIDSAYNYVYAPVLFKPTLAHGEQTFRPTRDGALAYFVGGSSAYPEDAGFALKGWVKVQPKTEVIYTEGNIGMTMGHFTFINEKDDEVTVEKTFVFRRGDDGKLRIVLHKSTIPFNPGAS